MKRKAFVGALFGGVLSNLAASAIIAVGGTIALFGRQAFSSLCGLPIIRGFDSCQPTIYDWVQMLLPYATFMVVLGVLLLKPNILQSIKRIF